MVPPNGASSGFCGDYRPLLPYLSNAPVGTLFLELFTPRAGEMDVLRELSGQYRMGIGVVNQKTPACEPVEQIIRRAERAIALFGQEILFTPDCGFATYADKPVTSAAVAEAKFRAIVEASRRLRAGS